VFHFDFPQGVFITIPKNITKKHILEAIERIGQSEIPNDRHSVTLSFFYKGILYPPKYLISRANLFATGAELEPSEFLGGPEANQFLKDLGFEIVHRGTKDGDDYPENKGVSP
jgi:5-methylcytosine-specific restriction protein A